MTSDREDQVKRPAMLKRLNTPTKPAAAAAVTRPGNISWIIGDAWPSTPMPAVTLRNRTAQSSQNGRVLIATSAVRSRGVVSGVLPVAAVELAGRQPGGGSRTISAPNIM